MCLIIKVTYSGYGTIDRNFARSLRKKLPIERQPPLMVYSHTISPEPPGHVQKRVIFAPLTFLRAMTTRYARLISLSAALPRLAS